MNKELFGYLSSGKIETAYHTLWIENGIIFQTYHPELKKMTLMMAKKMIHERIMMCNGKTFPMLTDTNNATRLDEDARIYLSSKEAHTYISAFALLVKKSFCQIAGQFLS